MFHQNFWIQMFLYRQKPANISQNKHIPNVLDILYALWLGPINGTHSNCNLQLKEPHSPPYYIIRVRRN